MRAPRRPVPRRRCVPRGSHRLVRSGEHANDRVAHEALAPSELPGLARTPAEGARLLGVSIEAWPLGAGVPPARGLPGPRRALEESIRAKWSTPGSTVTAASSPAASTNAVVIAAGTRSSASPWTCTWRTPSGTCVRGDASRSAAGSSPSSSRTAPSPRSSSSASARSLTAASASTPAISTPAYGPPAAASSARWPPAEWPMMATRSRLEAVLVERGQRCDRLLDVLERGRPATARSQPAVDIPGCDASPLQVAAHGVHKLSAEPRAPEAAVDRHGDGERAASVGEIEVGDLVGVGAVAAGQGRGGRRSLQRVARS